MRVALPISNNKLCAHFGHCEKFAFIDVDEAQKTIMSRKDIDAPPHQPGFLPSWIKENGANVVIASGMGQKARVLFAEKDIKVVVGSQKDDPEEIVLDYLNDDLLIGKNICDH